MHVAKAHIVVLITALFAAFSIVPLQAADNNLSDLINTAGMQRMLSQRIAKSYLYQGIGISEKNNRIQLKAAIKKFKKNFSELTSKVKDSEIQKQLSSISTTFSTFNALVTQSYTKKNAASVLDMSETLLKSSHEVVLKLEALSDLKIDHIINLAGKQRMLSQRISKYYIAHHAGFQDENIVHQLKNAVAEFESALNLLISEKQNTKQINTLLSKIKKQWESVAPYFLNVRKGGLPLMVLSTTDEITKLSNKVTDLYVEVTASK